MTAVILIPTLVSTEIIVMAHRYLILQLFAIAVIAGNGYAETTTIAVASNFTNAMGVIIEQFERDSGHKVNAAYGSSGKLFAQINNGAPFQVFFSADQDKAIQLEKAGLAISGSRFTYAVGQLALWSSDDEKVTKDASVLTSGQFNKLALANPKLAPYGAAAVQVLEALNVRNATKSRWVQGENISQTYQFVATGNADLGFIALAQVMQNGQLKSGSIWIVPQDYYQAIRQDAVLLNKGLDNLAAKALLQFMHSTKAKQIIESFGYQVLALSEQ